MQAVTGGMRGEVRNSYALVNLHIVARELEDYRQELIDANQKEEHYHQILTPEYLNRISRPSKGNQVASGVKSLKLYEALIAEYGEEKATNMLVKNPTILGA